MAEQDQFLDVIDRDEAERRFHAALDLRPLGIERISLGDALGRVLAVTVTAAIDVPSFDRSNFDGYAVRAADTYGANELTCRVLDLVPETIQAGIEPKFTLQAGQCAVIATGGMVPRGADAIVMVESAEERDGRVEIRRAVTAGFGISWAGTDISVGETVLRAGTLLSSRETGVLAALGECHVEVFRQPRVTIISTGNEIVAPGESMRPAGVFDSNSQVLCDAVKELGGLPQFAGIVRDDATALRRILAKAIQQSDLVLMSGGTSKGEGDLCYRAVAELKDPGIVVHGVALKPGKPICMAVTAGKPVVVLPGFPTSAIFTFHEFVAPVLRRFGGRREEPQETLTARLAVRVNSEIGRTEYLLVGLVDSDGRLAAFPMGRGSGSVTTFSRADGFVTIPRHTEILEAGQSVSVRLLSRSLELADLVVIGSHCPGLDLLLTELQAEGITSRLLSVGSSAGLLAAKRGECDLAGIHLLDPETGQYNSPFITDGLHLIAGYRRRQGILFRSGDSRFQGLTPAEIVTMAIADSTLTMVNRNQGSGTRILIDRLLGGQKPSGYALQPSNHSAVAAAIVQGRADWGVAIEAMARSNGLSFVPIQDEHFDFVVPTNRLQRPAVQAFLRVLRSATMQQQLASRGLVRSEERGAEIP